MFALVFLTPLGAIAGAAVLAPFVLLAAGEARVARARALLGLAPPPRSSTLVIRASLGAVGAILALAAAQPALVHRKTERVRTDAQALFVIDISGSMEASVGRNGQTRLERAVRFAGLLRAAVPEVAAGIATLTDRILPALLPVSDQGAFDATLHQSIAIEQPPPVEDTVVATSFAPLVQIPAYGYFAPAARKRVVILLTDGESNPFDEEAIGRAFARTPTVSLIEVQFWHADERIYDEPDGGPDPGYRPNPQGRAELEQLAEATRGRRFGEDQLGAAVAALRADLGVGPTRTIGESTRYQPLTPYIAIVVVVPLALLGRKRVL